MVEKEKSPEFSSDEDRLMLDKEIREVGKLIYTSVRKARKAMVSPGPVSTWCWIPSQPRLDSSQRNAEEVTTI